VAVVVVVTVTVTAVAVVAITAVAVNEPPLYTPAQYAGPRSADPL
jgi:hypothetical protein